MTIKSRLSKLEAVAQPAPKVNAAITDEVYSRTMETLAAALYEITGQPVTAAEAEQAIQGLNHEH